MHASPIRLRRPEPSRIPRPLALLLLIGCIQLVAWDIAVPAFQGPDEDAHFAYVQHLGETGHLPSPTIGPTSNSSEAQLTMESLNLIGLRGIRDARPAWSSADLDAWRALERSLPGNARDNGSGPNPQAKNPPLYYALMAIPYKVAESLPLLQRLFVLRLFNLPFYLATIALTWLIAGEILGRLRWKQTVAAGAVALHPQLAFMSAIINSDVLLTALTTAFLYASLLLVKRGPSPRLVVAASGLAGAATMTHGRGLITLPVLAVALVATWLIHRPTARETLTRGATAAATLGVALGLYLAVGSSSGGGLYGGQVTTLNGGQGFRLSQFLASIYQFYLPRPPSMMPRLGPSFGYRQVFIETFYGAFGWLEVTFKVRLYDALQLLSGAGLVGLYTACVVRWRSIVRSWGPFVVMAALLLTTVVFLHYVSYRALLTNQAVDPLIVGRYLLPIVSLFGLAIACTLGALPRRLGQLAGAIVLTIGVLLALTGIAITAVRFYA